MSAKSMAYSSSAETNLRPDMYRLSRGFPYMRGGKNVVPIPQFKGLPIYSHAPGVVPPSFNQTMTTALQAVSPRIKWATNPVPNTKVSS
jgi:hypothetical protein